jgi:DNA invertase Pin-like site-specific DNA recombinase
MNTTTVVSYLRVSTERQGASGLGLEAQRATVADFCKRGGFTLAKEYVEVESGRNNARPVLQKAVAHARRIGATLLVAKLDRLSRSVQFIATVLNSGCEFRAADVPDASRLLLHILSAVAEAEAFAISQRTQAALTAAKARGVLLGGAARKARELQPNLPVESAIAGRARGQAANRAKAVEKYADVLPIISSLRDEGLSLRAIAAHMNSDDNGATTWTAVKVKRVLDRAA